MSIRMFLVCVGFAMAGCTPNPEINSAKAIGFQGPLRTLFVITEVGSRGELSGDRFSAELQRMAGACRIRMGVSTVTELDLDPEVHVTRMKRFGTRHVLTVHLSGMTKSNNNLVEARYDAQLQEDTKRIVWRATLSLHVGAGDEIGSETLAYALMAKLGEDGIIQRCATHAPSTLPGAR